MASASSTEGSVNDTTRRYRVLDTHVHLWPSTAVSPKDHAWMAPNKPGHALANRHGTVEYLQAMAIISGKSKDCPESGPEGFIYIETDRTLPRTHPGISEKEAGDLEAAREQLVVWAQEPLNELSFLRRIVEGTTVESDGVAPGHGSKLRGCVVWAPFHLHTKLFELYLDIAEKAAGPELWARVVGFRYLIQHIKDEEEMRRLIGSDEWQENILSISQGRDGTGWTFDIGVDAHGGGVWQVEAVADMVQIIRHKEEDRSVPNDRRVRFILNHLCKPDLTRAPSLQPGAAPTCLRWAGENLTEESRRWRNAIEKLAAQPGVYMKLSGALNEMDKRHLLSQLNSDPLDGPGYSAAKIVFRTLHNSIPKKEYLLSARIARILGFYASHVFEEFGSRRIMFGSDWPVCNMGGPGTDSVDSEWRKQDAYEENPWPTNWELWRQAVMWSILFNGQEKDAEDVFWRTGCEAYRVALDG